MTVPMTDNTPDASAKSDKVAAVAEIAEQFKGASAAVVTGDTVLSRAV